MANPSAAPAAPPAGFTEPPIVFYGSVSQTADGYTLPYTSGQLAFTVTPASGAPFQVRTSLTPLPGNLSYRLEIPVARVPAGFSVTPATLVASSSVLTHQRGGITLDGRAVSIASPVGPNAGTFNFAEPQRGKAERVDLTVTGPFTDSDGDGLPDWWEDLHGLNKYDPSDATALDQFGARTFLEDYQRRIDPTLGTEYDQWTIARALPNATRQPLADADRDGVPNVLEFALDTDPANADSAVSLARRAVQVENFDGSKYLTMTVQKPGRSSVAYLVESSGDAQTWSSAGLITLTETAGLLKVRDAVPLGAPGVKRFLRLRVALTP